MTESPNPIIYITDDATEEEVYDAAAWLRNREFERHNPDIFGQ
jgi:hypothetical protein